MASKGQLHGAYEQEIGLECRKNDVASCSASVDVWGGHGTALDIENPCHAENDCSGHAS
jgi:hypothetical protein